ncbi:MAG: holo-[acyl-carrier-protein] synthase [Alicyclobacillus sp. RIFOXYA1_FULL_53_8]|nr:MAG: holo-[acyl-carrier-protein] synthase [Alicyclobacillus sp. RIFOXYA1_FULL_53_8]
MIHGLGTDVVTIARIRAAYERYGQKFAAKVLSAGEWSMVEGAAFERQVEFLAGRFAAKEAMSKAAGVGLGRLGMNCVELRLEVSGLTPIFCSNLTGKPFLHGRWHVSISHSEEVAFAVAIWEE